MSAIWPVHVALVARLKATAGVVALLGANPNTRVFDGTAPQGTAKPYVVIDSQTGNRARTLEREGDSGTTNVNIWSSYQGIKEVSAIEAAVKAALVAPVTVPGWGTVRLMWDQTIPITEESDLRHLVVRFRYFVLAEVAEA